jgi:hypothetical protein
MMMMIATSPTSQNSSKQAKKPLQGGRKVFFPLSAQHVEITESAIKIAYLLCGLLKKL